MHRTRCLPYEQIRWIENEDIDPKELDLTSDTKRAEDMRGRKLLLFTTQWAVDWATEHNPGLRLADVGGAG